MDDHTIKIQKMCVTHDLQPVSVVGVNQNSDGGLQWDVPSDWKFMNNSIMNQPFSLPKIVRLRTLVTV